MPRNLCGDNSYPFIFYYLFFGGVGGRDEGCDIVAKAKILLQRMIWSIIGIFNDLGVCLGEEFVKMKIFNFLEPNSIFG